MSLGESEEYLWQMAQRDYNGDLNAGDLREPILLPCPYTL